MWDGDLTGEVVDGRYALGDLYGSGGMAEVYRAFDTRLDRRVAVKLFQGTATREDRIRLDREAQVLAGLRYPGVVAVYDTGSFRGRPFYVMQAVEGGTLRRRMREPLAPEVVARIGAQVARILAHVHRHDVVHRDVKPSNILLDAGERRAYLADFGLALQAQATRVTRSGVLVGTAGYLAPEQVRGGEVGPAADVYALGLVLLECLTGRPEYPGGDTEAALARLHRDPRVPANLPDPWVEALTAMTHALPTKRPTADECARLLTAAEPASAGRAPAAVEVVEREPDGPEPPRRRRALVVGGVAGVVGVAAVLLGLTLVNAPPEDLRQQFDVPASTAPPSTVVVTGPPSTVTEVAPPPQEPLPRTTAAPAGDPAENPVENPTGDVPGNTAPVGTTGARPPADDPQRPEHAGPPTDAGNRGNPPPAKGSAGDARPGRG